MIIEEVKIADIKPYDCKTDENTIQKEE